MDNSEKEMSKLKFCYDQEGRLLRCPAKTVPSFPMGSLIFTAW